MRWATTLKNRNLLAMMRVKMVRRGGVRCACSVGFSADFDAEVACAGEGDSDCPFGALVEVFCAGAGSFATDAGVCWVAFVASAATIRAGVTTGAGVWGCG